MPTMRLVGRYWRGRGRGELELAVFESTKPSNTDFEAFEPQIEINVFLDRRGIARTDRSRRGVAACLGLRAPRRGKKHGRHRGRPRNTEMGETPHRISPCP